MFSSNDVPESLKCPACQTLLCVPQKMTPCGCVVCLDCTDSVVEKNMESMQCCFCKKMLHETPDYVNDDETQLRLQSHLQPGSGSSSPQSSSGVSSDESQEKTDVSRESATEEEMVRAPKRKAVSKEISPIVESTEATPKRDSKEVAPAPECSLKIEVLATANSSRLTPSPSEFAQAQPQAHQQPRAHQQQPQVQARPQVQPRGLPDFDPLAAFNDFLASKDKRDKVAKRWVEESRRYRDELRAQRRRNHHYNNDERDREYRSRSKPYYRR